ncbi:NlpC/P60 family protein [Kribbella flavida]|nr:C40 family peptidase [Kribbella flavida]
MTGTMALTTVPAQADPRPPVIPSRIQVDAARQAAAAQAAEVAAIEQRLAGANARLEQLGRASGIAAEKYNGAVHRLRQAQRDAAAAADRATKAAQKLAEQRRQIGRFAAASYQGGGDVAKLAPLLSADGPQQLLDSAGASRSVSQAMQGSYLRFTATQVVSNAFKVQADQAVAKVKAAADEAAKAKAAARSAEADQAAAVAAIGGERRQQIARLATLRRTSYQVADQRQRGLEELARQRAAALAAQKAEQLRRRIAAHEAAERARIAAEQARLARAQRAEQERRKQQEQAEQKAAKPPNRPARPPVKRAEPPVKPAKPPKKKPKADRPGNGGTTHRKGASAAIAFALSQLGEPYVWGAQGPSSWDCSGLTMAAWETAGVRLPHYSVAQYEQVRHISEEELRPGDLIFWSEQADDPGTIFHVALYLGGGRMVHAPRSGRPVTVDSVYYWEDPDFFGRP